MTRPADANAVERFRSKWADKISEAELSLNLLLSERENDFSGAIIIRDDSYLEEFVYDLASILEQMGKIGHDAVMGMRLLSLVERVDHAGERFQDTGDENLKPHTLYVFNKLKEFAEADLPYVPQLPLNAAAKDFVIDRLGSIVDNRYVIVVGNEEELAAFCSLNARFLHTFDQHRINLKGMDLDELYRRYLDNLDDSVRSQLVDVDDQLREFRSFVTFNRDSMPFQGAELADYLAKHANALKRPELPRSRYHSSSLEEMLDSVVGLENVKDTVRQLETYAVFRKEAQALGREMPSANMHMLFLGNPGTGKTTMARIISSLLFKIGIIRQNKCLEVTAKDLIAGYVGQTDKRTAEVIHKAIGGILFIDEAYALAEGAETGGSFSKEAVAELVKAMEDYKDELIVIFAGYEREMADFVELNSGLTSRIGYTFHFDDYTTDELLEIFRRMAKSSGFSWRGQRFELRLREIFDYHRRFRNFGNGRFVAELLQRTIIKHAAAGAAGDLPESHRFLLRAADLPTRQELRDVTNWEPQGAAELLEPLVGIDDLRAKICELEHVVSFYEVARKQRLHLPDLNLHMVFTGNPGTGKTTVARIIGKVLYNVGTVPTNRFVECEAKDLARHRFRSETTSVERIITDAMGGVLFIDEAYSLLYVADGDEIIATLIKAMEDHKGEFVVIFAGYRNEMREFIDRNPGLASRVGYAFDFEDYGTDELVEIFRRKADHAGLKPTDQAMELVRDACRYFHGVENFGNGRFVDKLLQETIAGHARNLAEADEQPEDLSVIEERDVPSIEAMCKLVSAPVYGPSDVSDEEARRRVATHEMGHAVCRLALTGATDIVLVTIEQEGNGALGYVQHKGEVTPLPTDEHLFNTIVELLGGMAAESLILGSYSAGNSSDLEKATAVASRYVASYGMSPAGLVQYLGDHGKRPGVNDLPKDVRDAMRELMDKAFAKAQETISQWRGPYDQMVEVLLQESTINGERITEIWKELTEETASE